MQEIVKIKDSRGPGVQDSSDISNTQLSGLNEREMNHPLALCELALRPSNISAGHIVKQAWLLNGRILGFFLLACADVRCLNWLKQCK